MHWRSRHRGNGFFEFCSRLAELAFLPKLPTLLSELLAPLDAGIFIVRRRRRGRLSNVPADGDESPACGAASVSQPANTAIRVVPIRIPPINQGDGNNAAHTTAPFIHAQ